MLHYLLDTSIMEASFPFLYVTSSSVAVYHQQHKSNLNIRYLRVHVAQSEAISFSYLFHRWCQEAQSASLSSATPACPSPSIPRCAREREARTHALIRCGPALSHLLPTTRSPAASSLQRTLRSHEGFASWGRPQRFSCIPHNSFSWKTNSIYPSSPMQGKGVMCCSPNNARFRLAPVGRAGSAGKGLGPPEPPSPAAIGEGGEAGEGGEGGSAVGDKAGASAENGSASDDGLGQDGSDPDGDGSRSHVPGGLSCFWSVAAVDARGAPARFVRGGGGGGGGGGSLPSRAAVALHWIASEPAAAAALRAALGDCETVRDAVARLTAAVDGGGGGEGSMAAAAARGMFGCGGAGPAAVVTRTKAQAAAAAADFPFELWPAARACGKGVGGDGGVVGGRSAGGLGLEGGGACESDDGGGGSGRAGRQRRRRDGGGGGA